MKVQLLPRGIRIYFWIICVHVWTDGNDHTGGAETLRGFFYIQLGVLQHKSSLL